MFPNFAVFSCSSFVSIVVGFTFYKICCVMNETLEYYKLFMNAVACSHKNIHINVSRQVFNYKL